MEDLAQEPTSQADSQPSTSPLCTFINTMDGRDYRRMHTKIDQITRIRSTM